VNFLYFIHQLKGFSAKLLFIFLAGLWFISLTYFSSAAAQELTINLVAVNASENEEREIDVKYHLPPELEPDDILDTGPLVLNYDVDMGSYYVHAMIKFAPKESKTFKVKVRDVWIVTQQEVDLLKQQLDESLKLLEGGEGYEAAKATRDKLFEQLDFILNQQNNYSENIARRLEQYRAYSNTLNDIRGNVYNPEYLVSESVSTVEQDGKTVKFVINVENPDKQSERTLKHKHFLPEEVRAEHVVDNQGFDVRFDDANEKAYLSKEEILQPGEQKKYVIQIKDIWQFPMHKLEGVTERADIALKELKDSVYGPSGQYLYDAIMDKVEQIEVAQSKTAASITEHIGLYRINMKRFEDAKQDLERLEQMMAIIRAAKLEELESKKVKNVLQRLQSLRGLKSLSEAVFKRGIKVTTTWKIILGTIFFLTVFTTLHFVLWAQRSRKMGEEKGLKEGEEYTKITSPQETI
jgi:hypothetical protein